VLLDNIGFDDYERNVMDNGQQTTLQCLQRILKIINGLDRRILLKQVLKKKD
jgi:hypothetical protein